MKREVEDGVEDKETLQEPYLSHCFTFLNDTRHLELLPADGIIGVMLLQEPEHVLLLLLARWNGTGPGGVLLTQI